ncbi:Pkinase-domain-containing protein [Xylona heveae TC161]|uniref:non-specific serine/threonine protein kinase n=1 Tax=Xylona heveae (strain CBS 132557 / TC161) TaxID=1328760 RepID=A0A165GIB5_XYLHT|nr:Pkinase-domain-containing protein [Xylona heveae TC161]KZF22218.1 Pkinase-domain-containing protein [Xylona heveae TC161]
MQNRQVDADGDPDPPERSSTLSLRGRPGQLGLPKNRSTGNFLNYQESPASASRTRHSFDAGLSLDYDVNARSPIIPEHEHGLGASGLRRIRQQPPALGSNQSNALRSGSNAGVPPRSSSMTLSLPSSRTPSISLPNGPASPTFNFSEDLSRFPCESLHSFSFAHQSEEYIHNRQNVLKRSMDFLRDRLGWATSNPGIASAQARISGDQEAQSMMELLARANLVRHDDSTGHGLGLSGGPLTGPAELTGGNIFEKNFFPQSQSPEPIDVRSSAKDEGKMIQTQLSPNVGSKSFNSSEEAFSETTARDEMKNRSSNVEIPPTKREQTREEHVSAGLSPTIAARRMSLKRTYTDTSPLTLQSKLMEAMAQPYIPTEQSSQNQLLLASVPSLSHPIAPVPGFNRAGSTVHSHASRWAPAAQAIFTTEATAPWTILAANDLACLVFGVTKAEVRKIGIMEVVREERRKWLEEKLQSPGSDAIIAKMKPSFSQSQRTSPNPTTSLAVGRGVTAQLLSKPSSRQIAERRAQTDDGSGSTFVKKRTSKGGSNHAANKSRGVLLCGDVVPIQKRNGAIGSASLWVKEKRGGLIWVLEEIREDVAYLCLDEGGCVAKATGAVEAIWGEDRVKVGMDIGRLIPQLPRMQSPKAGEIDIARVLELQRFCARTASGINIPLSVDQISGKHEFRISSFPHIAGIMVLSPSDLRITSSNPVFSAALFGQPQPDGLRITDLIPDFERLLRILTEEDKVQLVDGVVIPEHSFRRARALIALRDGKADAAAIFLRPVGLVARHRDGSEIKVDVQMRVVKSDSFGPLMDENVIAETSEDDEGDWATNEETPLTEVVYALWITYSRQLHGVAQIIEPMTPLESTPPSPPHQPSPGQSVRDPQLEDSVLSSPKTASSDSLLSQQIQETAAGQSSAKTSDGLQKPEVAEPKQYNAIDERDAHKKKTISDFVILEDMGQGAYGQVKLARYKKFPSKKVVLKYVTKRRILVDTWTRDRRLGTVPLEIHVLDYLRRDGLKHPNIVEMSDFFEDEINYYIEMVPHGIPGMDLFDYIELRVNMEEAECKSIFVQVANAIHHLHTKALVVHRDIKDENVVLDGEGNIKLIDFGSAAYIKNGPFDVFVGTIDYAAPEVLAGKSYRGKEQDVWALGILLYTIIYKENPFYSIDEIMDHDLRVPYIMSEDSIDLIRLMLNRDVDQRISISQVLEHRWCQSQA